MLWLLFILSFVVLITWVLITPLFLVIDTETGEYSLKWQGIGAIYLTSDFHLNWRLLYWKKEYDLFAPKEKPLLPSTQKATASKKSPTWKPSLAKVKHLSRTFQVKTCSLNLDTDNYLWNAYLFPIFYFLNTSKRNLRINFKGEFQCHLIVENRLYRLLYVFLRY
ncbi:MAG: hypothetical protein R2828_31970 [Saprospiraceae bacterium]